MHYPPSQEPNTLICPAPNESILTLAAYFQISIYRSTSRFQISLPFTFSDQNVVRFSSFSCVFYLLLQSYSSSFNHSNPILWIPKVYSSPLSFFVLVSDNLLATFISSCLLSAVLPCCDKPKFQVVNAAFNVGDGKEEILRIWFCYFGSQIFSLPTFRRIYLVS
jgi:hypothetical protein